LTQRHLSICWEGPPELWKVTGLGIPHCPPPASFPSLPTACLSFKVTLTHLLDWETFGNFPLAPVGDSLHTGHLCCYIFYPNKDFLLTRPPDHCFRFPVLSITPVGPREISRLKVEACIICFVIMGPWVTHSHLPTPVMHL
jgi:hypothetical protein